MPDAAPRKAVLWPDNLPAWIAWGAVQTQWRRAGQAGVRVGLDYTACAAWLQAAGYKRRRRQTLLLDLQECERAALDEWDRLDRQEKGRR